MTESEKIKLKIERLKTIENKIDKVGAIIENVLVKIGCLLANLLAITVLLPIPLGRIIIRNRIKKLRNKLKNKGE